jgi:hypothetical protein
MRRTGLVSLLVLFLLTCFVTTAWPQSGTRASAKDRQRSNAASGSTVFVVGGIDNQTNLQGVHPSLKTSELYNENTQTFTASGSMQIGRVGHATTVLQDGRVLVTGGDSNLTDDPTATAELYNPVTGTFHLTGHMSAARVAQTSTLLQNGQVLIAGGQDKGFINLETAELYDPTTETFSLTGSMSTGRTGQTATLLNNGLVLVAGGQTETALLATAELYNPATGTFTPTGSMSVARDFADAELLPNGSVLIIGGGGYVGDCLGCALASAEVYNPGTGTFEPVGSMTYPRRGFISALLNNGNVLVAGGIDDGDGNGEEEFLNTAEIFDHQTLTFSLTGDMTTVRFDHAASLLDNGNVLVTGGFITGVEITDSAEVYDVQNGTFSLTGNLTDARAEHTSNALP